MKCQAEQRRTEGIRLMIKMTDPLGKTQQRGSYVFPVGEQMRCSKVAYLYLDIIRMLFMLAKDQQADADMISSWHADVRTYLQV